VSVAAYAYEILNVSIMSDSEFDSLSQCVNPKIKTGNKKLDKFFSEKFDPSTGMWISSHPELDKIRDLYHKFYE